MESDFTRNLILIRLSAVTENYEEFGLPDYMDVVAKMESPRIIKTHLSWEMIPTQIHEKNVKVCVAVALYGSGSQRSCFHRT